jgi:hypothetical protein
MSRLDSCPLCHSEIPQWDAACPKCRYHPDSYNRAQDDVAAIFRLSWDSDRTVKAPTPIAAAGASASPSGASPSGASSPGWRGWLPHWLGGGTGQPPQASA